jgi:ligand-binding sensor domain-containing protein/two-component sensor histidine kinase
MIYKILNAVMLIVSIILFISVMLFPASGDYKFNQLTEADGLSQSTIFAMLQDSQGYLWLGTVEGLNRYDGYEFRVYVNNPDDSTSISDDFISTIFEDSKGNIWIGTINGYFNKFDRKTETFTHYNVNDYFESVKEHGQEYYDYPLAFSRNHLYSITSIVEDADNFLWIGTWGNGIIRFDIKNKTAVHFFNLPDYHLSLSSNRIMDILIDKENTLWVATFGGGLNRVISARKVSHTKEEFSKYEVLFFSYKHNDNNSNSISDDKIIKLFEDNDETLWIGTYNGGLNKLEKKDKSLPPAQIKFTKYLVRENTENCLCNNTVMDIVQDLDGDIWIGTFGGGIDKLNLERESFTHYYNDGTTAASLPDNEVLSLLVDNSGLIWVGAHLGGGVTKIQKNFTKFQSIRKADEKRRGLNDDIVWSIYRDCNKDYWVGTYRGGLNFINNEKNIYKSYKFDSNNQNSISNNHIRVIKGDNFNNLWIGTYNGGVNRFNIKTGKFTRFNYNSKNKNSLSSNQVQDILIESDTVIWVAAFGGGLNKLNFKTNSAYENPVFTNYAHDSFNPTTISDNRIYTLYIDKRNNLWVGTYGGGLNKFNRNSETFENFQTIPGNPNSLSNNKILSIFEDSAGFLWIGTSGGGLNKLNLSTNEFKHFTIEDGLTSGVVYGILEDNSKNLWLSTDDGIFRLETRNSRVTHFGLEDGLLNLEFSGGAYFKDKDGLLYFGGIKGINYFHPDSIRTNLYVPRVVISSINLYTQRLKGEVDELVLSYDQNFVSFEFSSLDFSNPTENHYAFKLEGLDNDLKYVDAGHRVANYINLPAGEYSFQVWGTNSDGLWSKSGTSVKLIIKPPFWLTWWFVTLIIIVVGSLLYYLSTNRIKHQLAIEKLKTKLASDLHDNVGASLTEISILSEVVLQKSNGSHTPKELKNISDISRQLVDTMSDIVFVVNPERDSLYDLIIKLKDSYNDFFNSIDISFKVNNIDKTNDIKLPMDFKQNLLLIFKEGINNCIKHSHCKKIMLDARIDGNSIEMILRDDGFGFDINDVSRGNGLKNIESRAAKIKGTVKWSSSPGKGTVLTFTGRAQRFNKLKSFLN